MVFIVFICLEHAAARVAVSELITKFVILCKKYSGTPLLVSYVFTWTYFKIKTANLHKQFTSPEKNLGKYIEVSLSIASG